MAKDKIRREANAVLDYVSGERSTVEMTLPNKYNPTYREKQLTRCADCAAVTAKHFIPSTLFYLQLHGITNEFVAAGELALGVISTIDDSPDMRFRRGDAVVTTLQKFQTTFTALPDALVKVQTPTDLLAPVFLHAHVRELLNQFRTRFADSADKRILVIGSDALALFLIDALIEAGRACDQYTGTKFNAQLIPSTFDVVFDCRLNPSYAPVSGTLSGSGVYIPCLTGVTEWNDKSAGVVRDTGHTIFLPDYSDKAFIASLSKSLRVIKPPNYIECDGMRKLTTAKFTNLFPGVMDDGHFCVISGS